MRPDVASLLSKKDRRRTTKWLRPHLRENTIPGRVGKSGLSETTSHLNILAHNGFLSTYNSNSSEEGIQVVHWTKWNVVFQACGYFRKSEKPFFLLQRAGLVAQVHLHTYFRNKFNASETEGGTTCCAWQSPAVENLISMLSFLPKCVAFAYPMTSSRCVVYPVNNACHSLLLIQHGSIISWDGWFYTLWGKIWERGGETF